VPAQLVGDESIELGAPDVLYAFDAAAQEGAKQVDRLSVGRNRARRAISGGKGVGVSVAECFQLPNERR
jgi:hypothetical protein